MLPAPVAQGKIVPAVDLMALDRPPGCRIDRSTEPDANARDIVALDEPAGRFQYLLADSLRAALGLGIYPFNRRQFGALARADTKLQFRSADFYSEKHVYQGLVID